MTSRNNSVTVDNGGANDTLSRIALLKIAQSGSQADPTLNTSQLRVSLAKQINGDDA